MLNRVLQMVKAKEETCFLWGPRQTGKSTFLKQAFPDSPYYDLLLSDEFLRISRDPSIIRQELLAEKKPVFPVIIDEVQKMPRLLDEVQWMVVNKGIRFILCGSSPRKLIRGQGNLLGGRALRYRMFPLVYPEIPGYRLDHAVNSGLIPRHYLSDTAGAMLRSYVGDYLKEEIAQEGLSRNIPVFSRFLEAAAFSNGEIINYSNIARDCGISAPTVKEYFQILDDTLLGVQLQSYRKKPKRRVILAPRFYYFDVGIVNVLLNRSNIQPGSELFGKAFEQVMLQEILAHSDYSGKHYRVSYWRTASQLEVDFVLGEHEVAVEIKGTGQVGNHHLKGLKAFMEEYTVGRAVVVSLDPKPRKTGKIEILPWRIFLDELWSDNLVS